jgi:hypothetical protein
MIRPIIDCFSSFLKYLFSSYLITVTKLEQEQESNKGNKYSPEPHKTEISTEQVFELISDLFYSERNQDGNNDGEYYFSCG